MEDDWDLHAVVRGCCTSTSTNTTTPSPFPFLNAITTTSSSTTTTASIDPFSIFSPLLLQEDDDDDNQHLLTFPDLLATQTAIQELEQLCKPFFPQTQQGPQHQHQQQTRPLPTSSTTSQIPRSKRRKNQQKRVVRHVPAEGLSSDMWAWRKYGQKPIKGSPYPRGYYRCSSSKGCLARKQVERSRSDPSMFVITYTSEHNHPLPTHRNSLAGSTRHKSSAAPPTFSSCKPSCSPTSEHRKEEDEVEVEEEEELLLPDMDMDMVPSEEMFVDLEELREPTTSSSSTAIPFDDCFADHFPVPFPSTWLPNNAATAAGGS